MFLYTENISNRHRYVVKILSDRLGMPFSWITDRVYLDEADDVLFYGKEPHARCFSIYDSGLLSETDLRTSLPDISNGFFPAPEGFNMGFDLFSAIFFLLSRYEEYFSVDLDEHNRFKPENSLQFKAGILDKPVVEEWIYQFGSTLKERFDCDVFPPKYLFKPTFDVDVAYAYKGRPFWLTLAGYFSDFKAKNYNLVKKRFRVNTGLEQDPYYVYGFLKQMCLTANVSPNVFIQVGERGEFDKNLYPFMPLMKDLITDISEWATVGLHPSYASNGNLKVLEKEKGMLEKILGKPVVESRQHFLKWRVSETCSLLESIGISQEYSMGYASYPGFRAGTCRPFRFFDLQKNAETAITIHPFVFMDGTLKDRLKLTSEEAIEKVDLLVDAIKQNHGVCIFIWHNSSLSEIGGWQDWKTVLSHIFKIAAS